MLIKSQDGKQIVNLDNCISISITGDNHVIAFYPFYDGWDKLGTYSSTAKAQKVLDWMLELFDEYVKDQAFGVFKMPGDEEVEV